MNETKYLRIIPPVILLVMFIFLVAFIIMPDKEFSENENRYLESMPTVSIQAIKEGTWMDQFETYICDQFPLRDKFIGLKTSFEKLTFHTEINGIYVADDDYYIEPYKEPTQTEMIIRKVNSFTKKMNCDVALMLVPTAVNTYSEKLPPFAQTYNQAETLDYIYSNVNCDTIDVKSLLDSNKSQDGLYYHLDHHWTLKGAYYGYSAYAKWAGIECKEMSDYKYSVVTSEFKGTIYSKINDYLAKGDEMLSIQPDSKNITVTYADGSTADTIYVDSYLKEKDKYSYYLGNDSNSIIKITNTDAANDETLVIIKDSYANSVIPYLVDQYSTIYVVNPRYMRTQKISDFVLSVKADKLLLLFNMNTIDTDDGIRAIF